MKINTLFTSILMLILLSLTLTGCGFKDIDKRNFVLAVGIDPGEKEEYVKVNLKLAIPNAEKTKEVRDFTVITEEAKTIAEAVRIIKSRVDKEIDFGQLKTIILSEELLERDLQSVLDWFIRRRDIQQISYVALSKTDTINILQLSPKGEKIPSNNILLTFSTTGTKSSYVTTVQLYQLRRALVEKGTDPILPIIEIVQEKFRVNKLKIINGEKENMLDLTPEETKLFNSIFNEYKMGTIVIEGKLYFIVALDKMKTSYKLVTNTEKPYIKYDIIMKGFIEESETELKSESLPKYEKVTSKNMEKRVQNLFEKLQEAGVDPFGFGLRYRATHRGSKEEKMEKWNAIYPDIEFRVNVKAEITGTGIIE
ncbi:Ger(x)C family spore germination protein [Pontibacillus marinus]|uniref:Spore germination protein n=1 Tax=Pontibacillus marinus BH030004 = DSM 16465 TaxID=1385511 RepID=A0A0A5G7U0_9BACI|nr:Ger(x)C family spore germination protein [Pontibacillus marinus]KGX88089.1 hypothetical protein N783_08975 [Pontibacillus marinus BH030004 = DSM 16465]